MRKPLVNDFVVAAATLGHLAQLVKSGAIPADIGQVEIARMNLRVNQIKTDLMVLPLSGEELEVLRKAGERLLDTAGDVYVPDPSDPIPAGQN